MMTSPEQVQADFDRLAVLSDENWNHNHHYHEFLLKHLPPRLGKALDVGCGTGRFTRLLAARAEQVVGIDLSPQMIRIAQERSTDYPNTDYRITDLMTWDIPDASFDCIATIATLHHLPLEAGLKKFKAALKPGGSLLVLDLYQQDSWDDFARNLLAIPSSAFLKWTKNGQMRESDAARAAWDAHAAHDIYMPINEIRACCERILPGAVVRKHLFWRYSLVWQAADT